MSPFHADPSGLALLVAGGFAAGIINTMAGGGSLLTVPLLVMLGLPGTVANGTNRIAVLVQSLVGAWRFGVEGVPGWRAAVPILTPLVSGSLLGALVVSQLADETFERAFGLVMLALLVPALRPPVTRERTRGSAWSPGWSWTAFFAIGLYGGAFQAGVGIVLVLALARSGHDLVLSNSIKVVVVAVFTAVAVVVFIVHGQVVWAPAAVLAASTAAGASVGARIVVRGGDRVVRPVLAASVVLLAGRMLGFY